MRPLTKEELKKIADDYKKIADDYKKFCMNCGWNVITDLPEGCICPSNEEVWQCEMYRHYHPEEVKEFERSMKEWVKQKAESEK